jgi:hypothetical protein
MSSYLAANKDCISSVGCFFGFIGKMITLDQATVQLIGVGVCINKLAMQVFDFQFEYNIQFIFGLQQYVLVSE